MNFEMPIFSVALPEIFMLCATCLILLIDVFLTERYRIVTYLLAQVALLIGFILVWGQYHDYPNAIVTFSGNYVLDKLAVLTKLFVLLTTVFAFIYARQYIKDRKIPRGEYYVLGLFAVLGMMVMASAFTFLTAYLGLELLSLSLYAMVALQKDSKFAVEAAIKYFVMGAMASGLLLYGISLVYGVTGSINIIEISGVLQHISPTDQAALIVGLVFILSGLVFKFGAVPFHMWVPDVYQGAPTSVTLFIACAPKIAAFCVTSRILVEAMPGLHIPWQQVQYIRWQSKTIKS